MHGFLTAEATVIGVETRTSSPVRILRDQLTLQHIRISGLYPCGEGAGYAGGITSAFGGRRVFNGQPRAPHKGTDMRCAEGTPVKSACAGTVLLAENTYFGGNTVYVDHGQGVISTYSHLSSFDVKAGDSVRKGQTIGRSGSTGRVTGPHLHFGFMVQGVAVDAMPLLSSPPDFTGGPSRSIFDQTKASKKRSAR